MNKRLLNRILLTPTNNKLKLYQEGKKLQVTRSAVAVNPLTCYNVSTGNVMEQFANNVLTKHGDYGFVGGDTLEVTFDVGTKIIGSNVECPITLYLSRATSLQLPTNITGDATTGWVSDALQSSYDNIKTQDGVSYAKSATLNGQIQQVMLELDLTPLCNQLFSGSNAALKAALKSIQADIWAIGSGANVGVNTYGRKFCVWNGASWVEWGSYDGSTISKGTNSSTNNVYIQSSNKVYVLIYATYPSDGTIPSSVSLDYAKVTIQLNRTVDVVAPKQVYLPKYWAMVGSFSPNFDNTYAAKNSRIFEFFIDATNLFRFYWNSATKMFKFEKIINGTSVSLTQSVAPSFSKNQIYSFIVGQSSSGMFLYLLRNNNVVEKSTNAFIEILNGSMQLMIQRSYGATQQGDMFNDINALYDLQSLGKPSGLTDAEAEVILRGIQYPSTSEMVVNGDFANGSTGWTITDGTWSFNGGVATLTTGGPIGIALNQTINVLQNSTYKFKCTQGYRCVIDELDQNGNVVKATSVTIGSINSIYEVNFTTIATTAKLRIVLKNNGEAGTWSFDNISLKYVKPSGQLITAVNKELFDINAVTLHANATRSGNSIVLNANGTYQVSYIEIPVLPNNKYTLKASLNRTDAITLRVTQKYNNIDLSFIDNYSLNIDYSFTTSSNCNKIRLNFNNTGSTSGSYIFSDISLKLKQ